MLKPELIIKAKQYGGEVFERILNNLDSLYDTGDLIRSAKESGLITEEQMNDLLSIV